MKSKPVSRLLGLAFEDQGFAAAFMRRTETRLTVERFARLHMSLDPTSDDPDLVGREIRHLLAGAGMRERRCLVCVPLKWIMSARVETPELSEEDLQSFLEIRAEREFSFPLDDLALGVSRFATRDGGRGAMLAAVPLARIQALRTALRAAGLKPLSITLGVAALARRPSGSSDCRAVVVGDERGADLAVACGGGVAALRRMEEKRTDAAPGGGMDVRAIGRQVRITLGNLPGTLGDDLREVEAFGARQVAEPLAAEIEAALRRAGSAARAVLGGVETELNLNGTKEAAGAMPLLAAMAACLKGLPLEFEFLAAKRKKGPTQEAQRVKRTTIRAAIAAAAVAAALVGAVLYQKWELASLESEWVGLEPQVAQVETIQARIRGVRPWFDETLPNLDVLRALAMAFPERGTVWATSVRIKDGAEVTVSGRVQSREDLFAMCDRLKASGDLANFQTPVLEASGEGGQIVFAINFRLNAGK
ncbi:MAG: hypothetical protein NTW86_20360 [Candidatus Sumerlaeota bacterium]|nr:hypothetical protein [Candidatus Sumerlaeota bacterium]